MPNLPVDDQAGGELDEPQVRGRALFRAGQQPTEAVEPAVRHLDHPAPRWMPVRIAGWRDRGRVTCRWGHMRRVAPRDRHLPTAVIRIPTGKRQMGFHFGCRGNHRGIEQGCQVRHVVAVGAGHDHGHGHRNPRPLGQEVPFGPGLPRSVGVLPVAAASPAPPCCRTGPSRYSHRPPARSSPAPGRHRRRATAPPTPAPACPARSTL